MDNKRFSDIVIFSIAIILVIYLMYIYHTTRHLGKVHTKKEKMTTDDSKNRNYTLATKPNDQTIGTADCPVEKSDMQIGEVLRKQMYDSTRYCGPDKIPTDSSNQYFNKFMKFRDFTENNDHQNDLAYRVSKLYTDQNEDVLKKLEGRSIKDIYDGLVTEGRPCDGKFCSDAGNLKDIPPTQFFDAFGFPERYIDRDNWLYPNEKVSTGGEVDIGLHGNDENDFLLSTIN